MDRPKIKWSFTIVVDILLVNLAFLFAYLTSRQLGFDFLEQPAPLFAILQSVDTSPFQPQACYWTRYRRCCHHRSYRSAVSLQSVQTHMAICRC